jgi:p-aminobenzoyl-glutamate transporter AbgT
MLEKITHDFLDKFITELNKKNNKKKINTHIINPIICDISNKLYPYIVTLFIMYIIILLLIISILAMLISNRKK